MTQHPQFHEGTAQELLPYLMTRPNQRFRLIELSTEDADMPTDRGQHEEKQDLATVFAELIEAAKHVEREAPLPPTDPHEAEFRDALQEKYRKMGLHR